MLDDVKIIDKRDRSGALDMAATIYQQVDFTCKIRDPDHDGRKITNVIIAGMGGSSLAADVVKVLVDNSLSVPLEVVKGYDLPKYATKNTLVIASSFSGNTEETLSCLDQALRANCQIAAIFAGGKLDEIAKKHQIASIVIPHEGQPRMEMVYMLRAMLEILHAFGLITHDLLDQMTSAKEWLKNESSLWQKTVPTSQNYAKQLALIAVGKTPVFYGGKLTAPLAYKWKISWNENAKNVAFCNSLPEFNHNEFMGWTSHPVEKPFAVFDLLSELEHPRILKRFSLSDRMLSGKRPKATVVPIAGESILQQILWGCILADFASTYVGILNNVDPAKVELIEKFKKQLG